MKKIFFLSKGVPDKNRKWGSTINSLVRKCFENENFEIISIYLDEINKESKIVDSNSKEYSFSIKLNFFEKITTWLINALTIFHFPLRRKFNIFIKSLDKPDVVICMNTLSGYIAQDIKCKKIIFVGENEKILYKNQILNKLNFNFFKSLIFFFKNVPYYLFSNISSCRLYNKFNRIFFWGYHDFLFYKKKLSFKKLSYIENPVEFKDQTDKQNVNTIDNNLINFQDKVKESNKYNILIIGHLRATHQVEGLTFFFKKVKKELMKINLWNNLNIFIIGKFEPNIFLKKISKFNNVHFTGFVENINYFYDNSDCNLIISTPNLGNRSRVLDFWINKTPVVMRGNSLNYPQLIDKFNGLFGISPKSIASAIKEVTSNEILKRKITLNGYETAKNSFDLKDFKQKLFREI